jgi:hypothetical protein
MFKKFNLLFFLLVLTNCSAPGTALLGPAFTGATTKSISRAGLSYGSNQVMKNFKKDSFK